MLLLLLEESSVHLISVKMATKVAITKLPTSDFALSQNSSGKVLELETTMNVMILRS